MIGSVLVANRGEIACRIFRTARRLGIRTIAVATEADRTWRHWQEADEALFIGEGPAADSYMNIGKILDAAKTTGVDAIHPGYGFLSENAEFARSCSDAGFKFIGPPADAIEAMGSKSRAKQIMDGAGVPTVPGYHGERQQPDFLKQKAYEIGYPVVIKAIAGGGGRGMRVVEKAIEFADLLASAQREAAASFGNDRVLIERYLENPRHIEVQVMGDEHGNLVHLFERDCSVQRRHQKVIEEAPAPGLGTDISNAIGEAAVSAAEAVDYVNAGTVEFIVDPASLSPSSGFYFMEMNTRLQVEHPVTEMVTGLDLVEWQFRIASGEVLPVEQDGLQRSGHSIEVRIYAEDPAADFKPSMGCLWAVDMPDSNDVRVDDGITEGTIVGPHYDSMLAKLIVQAPDRRSALDKLQNGLSKLRIAGVKTNKAFLRKVLSDPAFSADAVGTGFIDSKIAELTAAELDNSTLGGVIDEWLARQSEAAPGPWGDRSGFEVGSLGRRVSVNLVIDGQPVQAELHWENGHRSIMVDGQTAEVATTKPDIVWNNTTAHVLSDVGEFAVSFPSALERTFSGQSGSSEIKVPMHGRIVTLRVHAGDPVEVGDALFTLEAMKMEHTIRSPSDGKVSQILVDAGSQVEENTLAIVLTANEPSAK